MREKNLARKHKRAKGIPPQFLLFFTTIFLLAPIASAQNVANPGFESELSDWATSFDYEMSHARTEAARTGDFGLRVADASPNQGSGLESLPLEATPGQKYEVTFWARTVEGEGGLTVSLRFFDGSEKRLEKKPPSVLIEKSPTWKQFTVSGTAPEESVGFAIRIESVPLQTVTVDLDDFEARILP